VSSFVDIDGVIHDIPGVVIDADEMRTVTVKDAGEFGLHVGRGHGWRLGLLVARNVEPGEGEGGTYADRNERYSEKVSARAFAKKAGTSAPRVLRYYTGWERAAAAGLVPAAHELRPGDEPDIDLSKLPAWKDFYRTTRDEPDIGPASWALVEGWHCCPVADLTEHVEPGSVDVFITDPPYPAEFLPTYGDLSRTAAVLLKPGGLCVAMAGQSYLPDIHAQLGDALTYHWTISYLTPGGQAVQLWDRNVNTFWKPVLVYANGGYEGDWFGDVAKSDVNDNDKEHHHWGQSESGMADLIRRVSVPGALVCDPFLGGGTTAVVAAQLGRRVIGSDIDPDTLEVARRRFL